MSVWWLVPTFAAGLATGWLLYFHAFKLGMKLAGRDTSIAADVVSTLSNASLLKFKESVDAEVAKRDVVWTIRRRVTPS